MNGSSISHLKMNLQTLTQLELLPTQKSVITCSQIDQSEK